MKNVPAWTAFLLIENLSNLDSGLVLLNDQHSRIRASAAARSGYGAPEPKPMSSPPGILEEWENALFSTICAFPRPLLGTPAGRDAVIGDAEPDGDSMLIPLWDE